MDKIEIIFGNNDDDPCWDCAIDVQCRLKTGNNVCEIIAGSLGIELDKSKYIKEVIIYRNGKETEHKKGIQIS